MCVGGGGGGGGRLPKDCTRKSHFPKDGAQKSHSRPSQRLWNHIAGVNDEIRSALHLYLPLFGDDCEWVGVAKGLYAEIPHTSFTESAESVPHRYDDGEQIQQHTLNYCDTDISSFRYLSTLTQKNLGGWGEWIGGAKGLCSEIPHTSFTESAESILHRYDDAELQNTYIKSL